ncbi:MAG: hypothetical protein KAS13_06120 [Candidatus Omnitrophica bacterium]|nr:hypothetical protein [Candidatus Omnitrophota bacterium]
MLKSLSIAFIWIIASLTFVVVIAAEGKDRSRVIYEENTTFKDAKHRAKVLSQMKDQELQAEDKAQEKQLPSDDLMEKILPFVEKLLGKNAVSLLDAYRKGGNGKQDSELGTQKPKGEFREFNDDEPEWKGLRRTGTGNSVQ